MPFYSYKCRECGMVWDENRVVGQRDVPSLCPRCESNATYRQIGAGVHMSPVPGTGNWRYARELEERADRLEKTGAVTPDSETEAAYERIHGKPFDKREAGEA